MNDKAGAPMTTKPLHVAIVSKGQLRFFQTPNDDGGRICPGTLSMICNNALG
jgi:hypothetical protein